jgi:hypothetical protein
MAIGPPAGPFMAVPGIIPSDVYGAVRLAPEGNVFFLRLYDLANSKFRLWQYRRQADQSWLKEREILFPRPTNSTWYIGPVARGPLRRALVSNYEPTGYVLYEMEIDDATGATRDVVRVSTMIPTPIPEYISPWLSVDGLRMMWLDTSTGTASLLYTDRPTIDAPWRAAELLSGGPPAADAFMTADCSRIYTEVLQSILWVQQR